MDLCEIIIYFSELIFKTPVLFRFVVNGGPVKLVGLWIGWSCICIGTGTVLVKKCNVGAAHPILGFSGHRFGCVGFHHARYIEFLRFSVSRFTFSLLIVL